MGSGAGRGAGDGHPGVPGVHGDGVGSGAGAGDGVWGNGVSQPAQQLFVPPSASSKNV